MTRDHARKQAIRARMAATGEPYTVAARALDAKPPAAEPASLEPTAAAVTEPATGVTEPVAAVTEPATDVTEPATAVAEPLAAAEPGTAAEPATAASAAAKPMATGSAAAGPVADAGSVADRAEALAEVIACVGRTLAASSARIEIRTDTDLGRIPDSVPRRRAGRLGRLADRAARRILGRIAPEMDAAELRDQFLHQFGAGFIEPSAGRYLVDFGGYAQVLVDGRRYGGLSGERLGPRYEQRPHRFRRDDPFDVLRKLQRATAARWAGTERVRWTTCRVVATTVDDDEFTVWLNDQRVQRFRTVHRGSGRFGQATRTETTDLWDYGVPADELDWSRLPAFRSPGDGYDVETPGGEDAESSARPPSP